MILDDIEQALTRYRFTGADEAELQRAVWHMLKEHIESRGGFLSREERLTERDRIDFLVSEIEQEQLYGIELKVKGSPANVHRQLKRYANSGKLQGLMLVTTLRKHGLIESLWDPRAIPLQVVILNGGCL